MSDTNFVQFSYLNAASTFIQKPIVENGTTVAQWVASEAIDVSGKNLTVNGEQVASTYAMVNDDQVVISPRKVAGA